MGYDKRFAKDVAIQIERRRRGRRRVLALFWLVVILGALVYLRCGEGFGLGGSGIGTGKGTGVETKVPTNPVRCVVRVSAEGITVDGKLMKTHEAVAACRKTDGALVTVTGDARQGDWDELRVAFEAARVKIFTRDK